MNYSLWKNGKELLLRFTRSTKEEALDVLKRYRIIGKALDGAYVVLRDSKGRVIKTRNIVYNKPLNGVYCRGYTLFQAAVMYGNKGA